MKSIGIIAKEAGISIRTLRYYDKIGILKPSKITDKGYRLYDDSDIKRLQKILLLKEVGFSLSDIKSNIENSDPEFTQKLLKNQKEVLMLKIEHLMSLTNLLDSMIQGEDRMDLKTFNKKEIDRAFEAMLKNLDDMNLFIQEHGGTIEKAKASFEMSFRTYDGSLKEYLGEKDMAEVIKEAPDFEGLEKSRHTLEKLYLELARKRKALVDDEVLDIIANIRAETIAMFPVGKQDKLFQDMAKFYVKNEDAKKVFDDLYGEGMADYYCKCVRKYYE